MSDIASPAPSRRGGVDWLPWLAGGLTVVVLFLFILWPLMQMLLAAFLPNRTPFSLEALTLDNFRRFIEAANYRSATVNTLIVSVLSTTIATAISLPAAYAVARIEMPFRSLIMALAVVPLVAPPFIGAFSWITLLGRNGIVTHYLDAWFGIPMPPIYGMFGVVLAMSLSYFPYIFLIVQGALAASDPYIEESATMMGASRARILRTITFPLVTPAIAAAAMIVFIKALGNFGVPAVLGGEMYVLPTLMYFQVNGFFNLNAAAAIALVNVAITLVAILILAWLNRRRRFVTVTGVTRRMPRATSRGAKIFANVYVWALLFVALLPQAMVVWISFAERWAATLFPTQYGFGNYVTIWPTLRQVITNSVLLAGAATLLTVLFGTLTAYTSVRHKFRGKWALDLTIMLPFVLPGIITGVSFLLAFNSGPLAMTGTALILILAYFVRRVAYVFRTVSASISQVDPRIEEASTVCGASWGRTMGKITVPLVAPGVMAGAIIAFADLVSEMSVTVFLYSAQWKTIAIAIFERLVGDQLPAAAAIGTVTIVLVLALVFGAGKLVGRNVSDMFK
jgi:iron(III) transport system permease protein